MRILFPNNGLSAVLLSAFLTFWAGMDTGRYLGSMHFLKATMENWQSEFLAMAAMVLLSIFFRQRGSPESKPVAAGMWETGDED